MVQAAWNWLLDVDWLTLISGAALTTITFALRLIMREPLKAIGRNAYIIQWLWWLWPKQSFRGEWEVTWKVSSSRLPPENVDRVIIRQLFKNVSFRMIVISNDGTSKECVFVGKMHDRTLTGRWYNPVDGDQGYYGVFQLKLHADHRRAGGAWAGFSNAGDVQADEMKMVQVL